MMNTVSSIAAPFRIAVPELARWLLIGLPVLGLIALLWPVLHVLWMTSSTYSHGYLVFGIAAWLVWREVRGRPLVTGRPSGLGLVMLLAVGSAAVLASAIDVQLVQQLAVPPLIVGGLWAGGGWKLARRFVLPVGYLVFAMSIWDSLSEPLRAITTVMVGEGARLTGIPVYIVGNSIHIPAGTFEVEGGCSGLNYFVVGVALGAFSALVHHRKPALRLLLFGVIAVVSVVANWVRVYSIVIAGHLTDMQHFLVRVDHYYFGWVLFLFMVVPIVVWCSRGTVPQEQVSKSGTQAIAGRETPQSGLGFRAMIAPAAALGVSALVGLSIASSRAPVSSNLVSGHYALAPALPAVVSGWHRDGDWLGETRPLFHGPIAEVSGRYISGADELWVFAAGYPVQSQGAELIYYANRAVSDRDIVQVVDRIDFAAGDKRYQIRRYRLSDREGRSRVVWMGYRIAGFYTSADWSGKILQALGMLVGRTDGQVFVLSAPCVNSCDSADSVLNEAVPFFVPVLLGAVDGRVNST